MVDVRREVGVAEGEVDVNSDECRKPDCICRTKRQGSIEADGKEMISNVGGAEKKGLLA
jgi:hypothetical protein